MISPKRNKTAAMIYEQLVHFPAFRLIRASSLAWKCNALIQADRFLEAVEDNKPPR